MLIDEGYRAMDAIEMMWNLRSPYVLENKTFERYLLSDTPRSFSHEFAEQSLRPAMVMSPKEPPLP